jgi:hypothetical protein
VEEANGGSQGRRVGAELEKGWREELSSGCWILEMSLGI